MATTGLTQLTRKAKLAAVTADWAFKRMCFTAVVSDRSGRHEAGGKRMERQCETEESLGSALLTRAENLSLPHCSSAQHTALRTEHDTR
ncbi:hypothetical protein SRHO_G00043790 [Serrasalmus rhombeus]